MKIIDIEGGISNLAEEFIGRLTPGQVAFPLFQALPDVIFWVKDLHGRFVYVNKSFIDNCQTIHEGKIEGKTDLDIFPTGLAAVFRNDDMQVIKSGVAVWNKQELVYQTNGGVEWRATSKIPLEDVSGAIVGTAGISRPLGHMEGCPVPSQYHEISAIVGAIYQCLDRDIRVAEIATAANISVSTLERAFKEHMGTTPKKFIAQAKISSACEKLVSTKLSVKEISAKLGFTDNASFTRSFKRLMGLAPTEYRETYGDSVIGDIKKGQPAISRKSI